MHKFVSVIFIAAAVLLASSAGAQTRRAAKKPAKRAAMPAASPTPTPEPSPTPKTLPDEPAKRNGRPTASETPKAATAASTPTHFYTFSRPGFIYSSIEIEHDDSGAGTIKFLKMNFEEPITDPIRLSPATLAGIDQAFDALDFINSTADYQYEKDLSNIGDITLTLKRGTKTRTAKFNWTTDKNAKFLMDEYRRVANEFIWKFEMSVARENQQLETPKLMSVFDGYYQNGGISDPPHLVAYLTELANDERLPLIARDHASRLIASIQKAELKKKKQEDKPKS